jgi:hypothetical protein
VIEVNSQYFNRYRERKLVLEGLVQHLHVKTFHAGFSNIVFLTKVYNGSTAQVMLRRCHLFEPPARARIVCQWAPQNCQLALQNLPVGTAQLPVGTAQLPAGTV